MRKIKGGDPRQAPRVWYYLEEDSLVETSLSPEQIFVAIETGGEPKKLLLESAQSVSVGREGKEWFCTLQFKNEHLMYIGEL